MARETQGSPSDEKKLEQYGVWVKVKPRDVTAPVLEESFELSDLEAPKTSTTTIGIEERTEEGALTAEEEKLLDELETELEPSAADVPVPEEEPLLADTELPEIEDSPRAGSSDLELEQISDEELPELEEDLEQRAAPRTSPRTGTAETAEIEVTLSDGAEQDHFDDLAALENELATVTTKTRDASSSSAEILSRIEEELRSIRTDLNQLRSDLSGLRSAGGAAAHEGPSAEAGTKGGFLDEDEDETIALTGDELDNILNTAEITEEAADAPEAQTDLELPTEPAPAADADILGYDSPSPEPVEAPVADTELELVEATLEGTDIADETLVLSDEDLLSTDDTTAPVVEVAEELPSELVLEELDTGDSKGPAVEAAELPEIDLEGIPEIESEPVVAPAPEPSLMDDESETIDLETLDLGEEPKVIDAVPEQVEEVSELEVQELESSASSVAEATDLPDVDLEALAAEAQDLEEHVPSAPVVEDLEIGELETLGEAEEAPTPEKEIEISFEGDLMDDANTLKVSVEEPAPAEELLEAEEVEEVAEAAAPTSASSGIPDNLKDEIRTVLKYMDHLLEALPDEKIQEFASSDYFVMYKKLFEDLGLGE